MPKELLTLQFGGYSNFVGAHFWNAQDELLSEAYSTAGGAGAGELDAGVLYQQGEAAAGRGGAPAFWPRLLVFDDAGAQGLQRAAAGA